MDPIQKAIEEIESHKAGDDFSYRQIAKKYSVVRSTLQRWHRDQMRTREVSHLILHPQQETELVQHIQSLTERRTPPTRGLIRSMASSLAKQEVSESWVTRFLRRNQDCLISRWQTGIDRNRHKADSITKYSLYFDLLHDKMKEYSVLPGQIYNIDEKGFIISTTGRSKRVFDKVLYNQKGVTTGLQDGNREWVTVVACVCSDGQALPPSLIFKSANNTIQSSWVASIQQEQHSVFVSLSPSGWTNNDIGLAWLKEVFDRETRRKARTSYRLLILDGHGSYVTLDFIQYCNDNKILLAVFPPHLTYTLQPLDVVLFKPLSDAYSTQLSSHLHTS
jgi:transposase